MVNGMTDTFFSLLYRLVLPLCKELTIEKEIMLEYLHNRYERSLKLEKSSSLDQEFASATNATFPYQCI